MGYSARRGFTNGKISGAARQAELQQKIAAMQEKMTEAQDAVEAQEFTASVGGGVVEAKVNGKKEVLSVTIKPEAVDPEDVEMLQDLVVSAVNEALRQAEEAMESAMGALTGGFFGDFLTQVVKLTTGGDFTLPALFTPLDDTLMILIGAMALGMVQIITGMAISFVRKLKNGQVMDAVWEELTWWVVFAGIGLMAAGMTSVVLYVGLAMVVLGPVLTNKGFGKITGIFGSLYNHITGYFGDILSYSRLMALMLAGSVIAQVFNTLGAIPGNIIVFLIISLAGNALNFALNLLGCYVHDLRLQCLEYFGKFYEDGGKPFKPLMADTKYVDITK
mgnify:CR=1 FL=1